MYGSDAEYQEKPHKYTPCSCFNKNPHCWYCGEPESFGMHQTAPTEEQPKELATC